MMSNIKGNTDLIWGNIMAIIIAITVIIASTIDATTIKEIISAIIADVVFIVFIGIIVVDTVDIWRTASKKEVEPNSYKKLVDHSV
jgi:FtsH-binding integral membrane protein